jgi:hypothetical protein
VDPFKSLTFILPLRITEVLEIDLSATSVKLTRKYQNTRLIAECPEDVIADKPEEVFLVHKLEP